MSGPQPKERTAAEWAELYAERGWYVFPTLPLSKKPYAGFAWKEKSTKNPETVRKAAASKKYENCNWALDCGRSGVPVVDLDKSPTKDGLAEWAKLPPADTGFVVQTPRDGRHRYYLGVLPNSESKLAEGIDTRGTGGYVLLPGSIVRYDREDGTSWTGTYKALSTGVPAPVPEWLAIALSGQNNPEKPALSTKEKNTPPAGVEIDNPGALERAVRYLIDRAPEAHEGSGGEKTTLNIGMRVRDFGVSEEKCLELMLDHWNETKSFPPWEVDELRRKIHNSYSYPRDRIGNSDPAALFPDPPAAKELIRRGSDLRLEDLKPRRWLLGRRYLPGYTTVTFSPGGAGKSFLTLLEAMAIASGKKLTYDDVLQQGPVWVINTEDPMDELERRVHAACRHHGLDNIKDLHHFHLMSGRDRPLRIVDLVDKQPTINKKLQDWMIAEIRKRRVILLVVDPLVKSHGVNENDNGAMDLVMTAYAQIAEATGCAVGIVHHVTKSASGHGDTAAMRGASAIRDAARIAHSVAVMTKTEAKEYGIPPELAKWYIRLDEAKANMSEPSRDGGRWYKRVSVQLLFDDPDTTGCLEPVDLEIQKVDEDIIHEDDEIKRLVVSLVEVGSPWSVYRLAAEVVKTTATTQTQRTIARRIEKAFESQYDSSDGISYYLTRRKEPGSNRRIMGIRAEVTHCPTREEGETWVL